MLRLFMVIALAAIAARAQDLPHPPPPVAAPAVTLKVGSDAPQLSIAKWVKGDAVTLERGRIYVVEFWATWCGPCIASMPHLSELQDMHKDKVTFIGVTSEDPNNALDSVEKMVQEKGAGMGYTVAWDDGRKTNEAYMTASGQRGIPCSFVVDGNGKIAYIGHPATLDLVLAWLVAGKWDAAKSPAEMAAVFQKAQEIFRMDRPMALQALPAFEKEHPEVVPSLESAKFHLLLLAGKAEEASAIGARMVEKGIKYNSPMTLNEVAWSIVTPEADVPQRDLDLAMKAAEKAVELSKGEDGAILDTLARVHFCKGDVAKAIELQEKAVERAGDNPQMVESLEATLEEYRAKASPAK